MTCLVGNGISICRTPGREEDLGREKKKRWCFGCRKRTWYRESIFYPDSLWYGPNFRRKCEVCKEDASLFPGWFHVEGDEA